MQSASFPRTRGLTLSALLFAACGGERLPAPMLELAATGDTILAPYGDVTDAAWLGQRRFVVIAPQDKAVAAADFARRTLRPWGEPRARELVQPFHLFRAGDSVYVADWMLRRLTSWSLAGAFGAAMPAPDGVRGALPRERDAAGHWYFELRSAPGPDGSGNRDSATIARFNAALTHGDTVARLAPFDLAEVLSDGRRRLERRLLSGQDRWGILPNGTVWVARIAENRIDWRSPDGTWHVGDNLPDPVLPITQNDRDLFLNQFDAELRPTVEAIPFAAIKAPFEQVVIATDGMAWMMKSRSVGDTIRSYQLIDQQGHLVATARHAGLGRLLALSDSLALIGEHFEGGTRLLLFRLPARPAPGGD